jgi:hypothetical protein
MGQTTDPENGDAVAYSIFMAVAVYGVSGFQICTQWAIQLN